MPASVSSSRCSATVVGELDALKPSTDMPLVVATTNPGKIREIVAILAGVSDRLVTLADLPRRSGARGNRRDVRRERAAQGALLRRQRGTPRVADDSGLEIVALDGAPGVHSARWPATTTP